MQNNTYVTLWLDVPICPNCKSIMRRQDNQQTSELICWDCKSRFELVEQGPSDKCMLAKEVSKQERGTTND